MSENENCMKNLFCPKCGQNEKLLLLVPSWVAMTDDGTDFHDGAIPNHDVEWDHATRTICAICSYQGLAVNFYEDTGGWMHPFGFTLPQLQYDMEVGGITFENCIPFSDKGACFLRQTLPVSIFTPDSANVRVRPSFNQLPTERIDAFTYRNGSNQDVEMVELSTRRFFRIGEIIYEEYLPTNTPHTWTRNRHWHSSHVLNVELK